MQLKRRKRSCLTAARWSTMARGGTRSRRLPRTTSESVDVLKSSLPRKSLRQRAEDADIVLIVHEQTRRGAAIERQHLERIQRVVRELPRAILRIEHGVCRDRFVHQRGMRRDRSLGHRARERQIRVEAATAPRLKSNAT